jgi:Protein of unknown function with HXXEE motif
MQNFLQHVDRPLPFKRQLWRIPIVLAIHNAEEALTMPRWVMSNLAAVRRAIPFGIDIQFSPVQLLASLLVATVVPFIVTLLCVRGEKKSKRVYLLLLLQAIVLLNVFIPHLSWTIRTLQYNPGLFTALFLNLPFSFIFFRTGYREGYIDARGLVRLFLLAAVIYPLVAWLLHSSGDFIAKVFFS